MSMAMTMPDIERYRAHVAGIDLPQSQKDEMILIVWRIMQDFVDRAYGTHPAQQCTALSHQKSLDTEGEHAKLPAQSVTDKRATPTAPNGGPC
jgi:hypothetical protein